jgi:2-polyprenyl-3-methyl-5-hydroxy-6-metoxy-1,4-benzoquinol methylase
MKNIWNDRYKDESFFYGEVPNDFLSSVANKIPARSNILCLAEGEGRNAVYLATLGHKVTAIDQSDIGLNKLHKLALQKSVQINTIVADLSEYSIQENEWDVIVSIWCHLPSQLRIKVHKQCVKGLKKNGLFILEAYTPQQLEYKTGGPRDTDLLMTAPILHEELKGLDFTIIKESIREIHEGAGHNGISAVVQVLASKNI